MTDLFSYPHSPGFKSPGTSQEAAVKIAPFAATLKDRILAELRKAPGTPDEIADRLGKSILSVRPRLSELAAKRLVEETGIRRKNASGMSAAEVRIKQQGGNDAVA